MDECPENRDIFTTTTLYSQIVFASNQYKYKLR
jgi:hypothetical protein